MSKRILIGKLFFLLLLSCTSTKQNRSALNLLPGALLHAVGRYYITPANELALASSGAHVGFSFTGNQCRVYTSLSNKNQHSYLQYTVDGVYKERVRINGNNEEPLVIDAPGNGPHQVWLYKTTEAHTGPLMITKIEANQVKPLDIPKATFIEFIGNSITCGAAADASQVACGTGEYHDQHNAYFAYGPRVARALEVNFMLSCVSGIGVYRNWNSNGPTMPQVYSKVDFMNNNPTQWSFDNNKPGIVSIALGTNDFSNGDGKAKRLAFDSSAFVSAYINFIRVVKSKYPSAQIALLSSPMVNGSNRQLLQNCITAVKKSIDDLYSKDRPVALFFFEPMQAHGCSGHPSVEDHAVLAEQLVPFFASLLKQSPVR